MTLTVLLIGSALVVVVLAAILIPMVGKKK